MGTYTAHWEEYKKNSVRGLCYLGLLVVLGLPGTALVAYGVDQITGAYPFNLHLGLLVAWLFAFAWLAIHASRVICPRCRAKYSRGKGLSNCPQCGLRMLQDEP